MRRWSLRLSLLVVPLVCGSCAWHKTADEWNGLVGPTGNPVRLNSTTKVGANFLIFFPFLGEVDLEGMVEDATGAVRDKDGNFVRVIQSRSDNYWYAVPPFTWLVTPVVHSLVVEYRPQVGEDPFVLPTQPESRPAFYWEQNNTRTASTR